MSEMGSILEYQEDLASAEAPRALPASDYIGEVMAAEIGISNNSGKVRADVTFVIKPDAFPPDYEDADAYADGKQVHFYVPAGQDKASRFRMRKFCEAIGVKLGKKIDVNDWVGKTAMLSTSVEEWEGTERERVTKVSAA